MVKRSGLIRTILRKAGQRRRSGNPERPYLTRKELLKLNAHLDILDDALGRKGKQTRSA